MVPELRTLVYWLTFRGTLLVHPCNAHPRHPWLEKPPERQPVYQITSMSFSLFVGVKPKQRKRQRQENKAFGARLWLGAVALALSYLLTLLLILSPKVRMTAVGECGGGW